MIDCHSNCRRRLSEASRPKLKSLIAKVASNLSMMKNKEISQSNVDDSEQKDDKLLSTVEQNDKQESVHDQADIQESIRDQKDKQESDIESSQYSTDEQITNNESDMNFEKTIMGQVYVDPMIAKLKITDVIFSCSISMHKITQNINFCHFSIHPFLEC